jgi:hypothetical protein
LVEQRNHLGLLARIDTEWMCDTATTPNCFGQRFKFTDVTRAACDANGMTFACKGTRDGAAEAIAGPDNQTNTFGFDTRVQDSPRYS